MKRIVALMLTLVLVFGLISVTASAEETEEPVMPKVTAISAQTHVEDYGQVVTSFELTFDGDIEVMALQACNFAVENNLIHPVMADCSAGVTALEAAAEKLTLTVDPFLYAKGFKITLVRDGAVDFTFTAEDVSEVKTDIVDTFEAGTSEGGLNYRYYAPESEEALPLVIWFHGGGEGGTDNSLQLTANRGAVCFAEPEYQEKHPCVVLAPQSANSWAAEELDEIAAVAQSLIDEGKVDANRVYAVGLAAQQATLRFSASHRDLLAAAMPIIYWKDFDEDWTSLQDLPMWCAIAENDFTGEAPNMQAFVDDMTAAGNENVKLTIWTDEEMGEYGLFGGLLHWGWIPTINNQEMIDWLFTWSR
ncbi:MAG: hypothetical protein Q4C42_09565 [Clostridia bacterium]|nr:hypothetical protein [Clostridia bacterium]